MKQRMSITRYFPQCLVGRIVHYNLEYTREKTAIRGSSLSKMLSCALGFITSPTCVTGTAVPPSHLLHSNKPSSHGWRTATR